MIGLNTEPNTSLLQQIQQKQNERLEQLASGKRINSAADGAAAQQIIDRLTSEIEGNRQSISNAFDGVSLAQSAEGGLAGINDDVNRIRELTIQSGNGLLNDGDRNAIQQEISQLQENITQTIEQTNFAGTPLLSEDGNISFQVGSSAGTQIDVGTSDIADQLSGVLNIDVTSQSADEALDAADEALEAVGTARGELGAVQNRFESTIRSLSQADINTSESRSRIADTDFAQATSDLAAADVLSRSSVAVQAQANQQQGQVLSLLG